MKKHLALLLALVLVLGLAIPSYAAGATVKVGVLKNYSDKVVTVLVDGKLASYTYDAKTVILLNDAPSTFAAAACKGTKVTCTVNGKKATKLNFAEIGEALEGVISIVGNQLAITSKREMTTDSSEELGYNPKITLSATKEEIGKESETAFTVRDTKTVDLGTLSLVKDTLKVSVDGKELKIITDEKAEFDKTVVGDEVKMTRDTESGENELVLNFEKEIAANTDEMNNVLKVNYDKIIYKVSVVEQVKKDIDKNTVFDLNGKETFLPKVANNSTYASITLSPEGKVLYVNSYYRDLTCTIDSIKGDTIAISAAPQGKAAFKDTLKLSKGIAVIGGASAVNELKAGDTIILSTDPYNGYQVVSITK